MELWVGLVPFPVPLRASLHLCEEGALKVDVCLVGQTEENEQDIRHLLTQLDGFVGWLIALVSVASRHDTGNFTNLLHENRGIRQLGEIPHPNRVDPVVDERLRVA